MNEKLKLALKVVESHHENVQQDITNWLNNEILSWNWWVLLSFIVIPTLIWVKVVDRRRILEILLFGTLVIIPTSYLDAIGVDLKFWVYPVQFLPITPRAFPFDIFLIPITYMLLYQFFKGWKAFLVALFIMALIFAFIGEPISHILNLVYYIKWKYYYSFLYYIILGISVKAIVNKCRSYYYNSKA